MQSGACFVRRRRPGGSGGRAEYAPLPPRGSLGARVDDPLRDPDVLLPPHGGLNGSSVLCLWDRVGSGAVREAEERRDECAVDSRRLEQRPQGRERPFRAELEALRGARGADAGSDVWRVGQAAADLGRTVRRCGRGVSD